jgi:hypothetical protein
MHHPKRMELAKCLKFKHFEKLGKDFELWFACEVRGLSLFAEHRVSRQGAIYSNKQLLFTKRVQ